MRVIASQNVTASALIFTASGGSSDAPNTVIIQNNSSDVVGYINIAPNSSTVVAADTTSFPIVAGGSIQLEFISAARIYAFGETAWPCSIISRY